MSRLARPPGGSGARSRLAALRRARHAGAALTGLAAARLRRRAAWTLLAAAGVAVATVALVGGLAFSRLAQDAALEQRLADAGPAQAGVRVRVVRSGEDPPGAGAGPADWARTLDPRVTRLLAASGVTGRPGRAVTFGEERVRDAQLPGGAARIAVVAVDGLARRLRVRGGRAPAPCRAGADCEAVLVGGAAVSGTLRYGRLRLTVVGRGGLDAAPAGPIPPPRGSLGAGATWLAVDGATAVLRGRRLAALPRAYHWHAAQAAPRAWKLEDDERAMTRLRADVRTAVDDATVFLPTGLLRAERERGVAAARQLMLVSGTLATLLLAFLAAAAAARREDTVEELARLAAAGARTRQLAFLVALEALAVAGLGVAAGLAILAGLAVPAAEWRDLRAGDVVRDLFLSPGGAWLALATLLASAAALSAAAASAIPRSLRAAGQSAVVVALIALVWSSAASGRLDDAGGGSRPALDPALLLLPGLVVAVVVLVAVRAVPPLLRHAERRATRRKPGTQLALLALARRPAATAAGIALVAVGLAVAIAALGHRATLVRGLQDAAALETGAAVRVADPAFARQVPRVLAGVSRTPVLRRSARTAGTLRSVTLLGVSGSFRDRAVPGASRGRGGVPALRLAGPALPAAAEELDLAVRTGPVRVDVSLALQRRDGRFARLRVGEGLRPGTHRVRLPVARELAGARLVALEVTVPLGAQGDGPAGAVTLVEASTPSGGALDVDGWVASEGARASDRTLRFRTLGAGYLALRHPQPAAREPLEVVVDPSLAAEADREGGLELTLPGGGLVRTRVAGVRPHAATIRGPFVVADAERLFAVANHAFPGDVEPRELWAEPERTAGIRRVLEASGVPGAAIRTREEALARRRDGWLARGLLSSLLGVAACALLVAIAVPVLLRRAAPREEATARAGLIRLGVTRGQLARQRRTAGVAWLAPAGVGGAAAGVLLSALLGGALELGADGERARPELEAGPPWLAVAAVGATWALAAAWLLLRDRPPEAPDG